MTDPDPALLGVDYGTRRIGLAIGDPVRRLAFAVGAHEEGRDGSVLRRIADLVAERGVGRIVVGLPLTAGGDEGGIAARARRFAERLEQEFNLPVVLWDERYSSQEADRWLATKSGRAKADRDALAAEIILQSYLDSLAAGSESGSVNGPEGTSGNESEEP